MRLVLVHGINQQGRDPAALKRAWIDDLEAGLGRPGALDGVRVDMPFYGDALFDLSRGTAAIAQGPDPGEDEALANFLADALQEQADAQGVAPADIRAEQERQMVAGEPAAVEQGFPMHRRINAIVGVLERISPFRGNIALKILGQAHAYLKKPVVMAAVDAIVGPILTAPGPMVVVSHSLGTVVTYRLLREIGVGATVPLYVTIGSPLTLAAVQGAVKPPFSNPAGVGRWTNARDPDDFISLNRGLLPPRFGGPVHDMADIDNRGDDAHAIPGYLAWPPLARHIGDALAL